MSPLQERVREVIRVMFEWIEKPNGATPDFCPIQICPNLCGIQVCWKLECGAHYCVIFLY